MLTSLVDGVIDGGPLEVRGTSIPLVDPSTGAVWAEIAEAPASEVDRAVRVSEVGFASWRQSTAAERIDALRSFAAALRSHAEDLVALEVRSVGKLPADVRAELQALLEQIDGFIDLIPEFPGPNDQPRDGMVWEAPGPVASILPWNAPLNAAVRRIAVTLATGGSTVIKASEVAPLTPIRVASLVAPALPRGVVGAFTGRGSTTGVDLVDHSGIAHVAFVGSLATGQAIAQANARRLRPATLEMGGKCAQVVLEDADVASAARMVVRGFTRNAGQICTTGSRLIVHRSLHDELTERVVSAATAIRAGSAYDPASEMGPLVTSAHRHAVHAHVERAIGAGATLRAGGHPVDGPGFAYAPTVLADVGPDLEIFTEEVFGPVLTVTPFDDDDEAVELANRGPYGIASAVWSANQRRAEMIARALDVGMCWINGYWASDPRLSWVPRRLSATGPMDFGREALRAFLRPKSIVVAQVT